ncbi:MAG: SDR family NAD(P)-dependent oxidoreductase [Akkermansiaceae bacterium]|nr:SDR family NAD(P)-dependent oxidoreductase [Verrucomicrobiales bacterium]
MNPKICLVTGANRGIGKAAAMSLAKGGAHLLLACRDQARGEAARAEIVAASGNPSVEVLLVDLSSQASIHAMAAAFLEKYERLDVLMHVAAIVKRERVETADGLEMMFAVNQLGPFLLTHLLLGALKAAAPSRVLIVTAPSTTSLDFDDLQARQRFNFFNAFGASKMANLLYTYALARRLEGTGVSVNAVHPGLIKSDLMKEAPRLMQLLFQLISAPPEKAGEALAHLALAPALEGVSGKFFTNGKEIQSNAYSHLRENQSRLWDACVALTQAEL